MMKLKTKWRKLIYVYCHDLKHTAIGFEQLEINQRLFKVNKAKLANMDGLWIVLRMPDIPTDRRTLKVGCMGARNLNTQFCNLPQTFLVAYEVLDMV